MPSAEPQNNDLTAKTYSISEEKWEELLHAFRYGNCVVLTGSGVAVETIDEDSHPLTELLALRLAKKLTSNGYLLDEVEKKHLYYTATEYLKLKGNTSLLNEVEKFYKEKKRTFSPLHELITKLPVSLILNTSPDILLEQAFKEEFKNIRTSWYSHKRDKSKNEDAMEIEDPTIDNPLIYNLLGNLAEPESLVLTEKDQLHFLEDVIQHNNAIPNPVLKNLGNNKVYLFIGFDFERWQLRILLRLLRLSDAHTAPVLAINSQPSPSTMIFFQKQYKVEFPVMGNEEFLKELIRRWEAHESEASQASQEGVVKVVYLFHETDKENKEKLDNHLAILKNNQAIKTWDETMLLAGDDRSETIDQQLEEANMILYLVSANSMASQRIYDQQLRKALERHRKRKAVICPLLMRPCSWEGASFSKLPTILPRNKKPVALWENPEEAMRHIGKELESFVEILMDNLV